LLNEKYTGEKVSGDVLQQDIFAIAKEEGISGKKAFEALYKVLLGKDHGPRAAWLLLDIGISKVVARLNEVMAKFPVESV
jgi:lysyl-tRNA synthetase class 1